MPVVYINIHANTWVLWDLDADEIKKNITFLFLKLHNTCFKIGTDVCVEIFQLFFSCTYEGVADIPSLRKEFACGILEEEKGKKDVVHGSREVFLWWLAEAGNHKI